MFSIKPRVFDISIDSSSLIIFSSAFVQWLQIIEKTMMYVFSMMFDILGFSNFLYLPQITQNNLFIF